MAARHPESLPFPMAGGYSPLAMNGALGGGTKYCTLQFLNYARWTSQQHSVNLPNAIKIMANNHIYDASGKFRPLGVLRMWWPFVTLPSEMAHWSLKVPGCIHMYSIFRDFGFGQHSGLFIGTAAWTVGEVAITGMGERFGVHMGLRQIRSYRESLRISVDARGNWLAGAYAGVGGLWLRNFAWNYAFLEWKRFFHNAVDKTPEWAPGFFRAHLDWLRSLEKKDQANILTFYAATLGTYLTFFNMAGDNIKTKMAHDPARYPSFVATAREIVSNHGILGFTRGSLFKGIYLIAGSTVAIGIQERLTSIMAALRR